MPYATYSDLQHFQVQCELPYFAITMDSARRTIIAADNNIPFIAEACAELGEVRLYDVRRPAELREALAEAEILLCRSTIRVDEDLLRGTRVRFVATATSGTDHFDIPWLERQKIAWTSAAGSNARSVAEWMVAVLLQLHHDGTFDLDNRSIGIVGVGHVGTHTARLSEALGLRLILNDPPREERGERALAWSDIAFSSFEQTIGADIVSLHTPLETGGPYPTFHLLNTASAALLKPEAVVVNAARGDVADPDIFLRRSQQDCAPSALDVFPDEPRIDPGLVDEVQIATPHVAGHSFDGKLLGTQMLVDALSAYLGIPTSWRYEAVLPATPILEGSGEAKATSGDPLVQVHDIVRQAYDPLRDDAALRSTMDADPVTRAAAFRTLRAEYPLRREFRAFRVRGDSVAPEAARILTGLSFQLI